MYFLKLIHWLFKGCKRVVCHGRYFSIMNFNTKIFWGNFVICCIIGRVHCIFTFLTVALTKKTSNSVAQCVMILLNCNYRNLNVS